MRQNSLQTLSRVLKDCSDPQSGLDWTETVYLWSAVPVRTSLDHNAVGFHFQVELSLFFSSPTCWSSSRLPSSPRRVFYWRLWRCVCVCVCSSFGEKFGLLRTVVSGVAAATL